MPASDLRVVHVLEAIGGGTKKHVMLLAEGLRRRGVEVVLVLPQTRPYDPDFPLMDYAFPDLMRSHGFDVRQFDFVHGRITPWHDFSSLVRLARYFRRERFSIVHTHSAKAGVIGRSAAWLAGIPTRVHTPYSLPFRRETNQGVKYWLYYGIERLLARATDLMIATSRTEFEEIRGSGIANRTTLVLIPNCFDLQNYPWPPPDRREAKRRVGLDPDRQVVGIVARLAPQKGVMTLVDASARILDRLPATQFVVVGDGEQRPEIERRLSETRLTANWRLAGVRQDYKAFVQAFDVFVFPSLWEGLPYAPIEAMALGTPVVATAAVGTADLITHDDNGLLVGVGDAPALADAVLRVLTTPDLASRVAAAGRRFVENQFGSEQPIDATLRAYQSARHAEPQST